MPVRGFVYVLFLSLQLSFILLIVDSLVWIYAWGEERFTIALDATVMRHGKDIRPVLNDFFGVVLNLGERGRLEDSVPGKEELASKSLSIFEQQQK